MKCSVSCWGDGSRIVLDVRAQHRCGRVWQDHSELFVVDMDSTPCAHALFVCAAKSRPPRPWQALLQLALESCLTCQSPLLRELSSLVQFFCAREDEKHERRFLVAGLPAQGVPMHLKLDVKPNNLRQYPHESSSVRARIQDMLGTW